MMPTVEPADPLFSWRSASGKCWGLSGRWVTAMTEPKPTASHPLHHQTVHTASGGSPTAHTSTLWFTPGFLDGSHLRALSTDWQADAV